MLAAEHLKGHDLAGRAVTGAIDAGKRAGANEVQHFVLAIEETSTLAPQQPFGLIVGQQLAAQQQLLKLVARQLAAADLT